MNKQEPSRWLRPTILALLGVGLLTTSRHTLGQNSATESTDIKIQRFVKDVQSDNYAIRKNAIDKLLPQIGPNDKDSVPLILDALKNELNSSIDGRRSLFMSLVRIGPAATPQLVAAVDQDKRLDVRLAAISALGESHVSPELSLPCLVRALSDDSNYIRLAAIDSIRQFGAASKAAIPGLITVTADDSDDKVRLHAIGVLGNLHLHPDISVPCLIRLLSETNPAVQEAAAFALSNFGPEAKIAIAELTRAIDDENKDVQTAALTTIIKLGPTAMEAVPTLLVALLGDAPYRSRLAARALRRIGVTNTLFPELLVAATKASSQHVKINAVWVLGKLSMFSKETTPRLAELLEDQDDKIVGTALTALAELGANAQPATAQIIASMQSENPVVKRLAEQALRKADPEQASTLLGKPFDAVHARLDDIKDFQVVQRRR